MAFDLWEEEKEEQKEESLNIDFNGKVALLTVQGDNIVLYSRKDLSRLPEFESILGVKRDFVDNVYVYTSRFSTTNAFVYRYLTKGIPMFVSSTDAGKLKEAADVISLPEATLSEDKKQVIVSAPAIPAYTDLLKKVDAYPVNGGGYRFSVTRVMDFETHVANFNSKFPDIRITRPVLSLTREPIVGFDGTLDSLKNIPVSALNVVAANVRTGRTKKNETMEERMGSMGIKTLHDLLFWVPRYHIDKKNPQTINNLVEGESATILGKITALDSLPNNMGIRITIADKTGREIPVAFFRQNWLRTKFREGQEVIVTGKFSWWNRKPQLNGSLIEFADQAAILPVVPVYKQSESKGVTTTFLISANRELLSRISEIELPVYLRAKGRMDYCEALNQLHFPDSEEKYKECIDTLAYYELVYMQIIIQDAKSKVEVRPGIKLNDAPRKLQARLIKNLPFSLTNSQKYAVKTLNARMADELPSSTLLNSDVGTGKSIVAQLACLKAVDSGYQAVLMGPTEILARQLYNTFVAHLEKMPEEVRPTITYLGGGMKAAEKKPILQGIKDGSIEIIVGTHSVISKSVKYHNLGFIAIDEQQKFGAEQRTALLNVREDGRVPDLLTQTATPIPRSTAQVMYGDMEMLELTDKPAGRIPIVTEWVQEDPTEIVKQQIHQMWSDIRTEAQNGNQCFVITPLVIESDKIDAASVEASYKHLKNFVFQDLRIGFVHGKMKQDEQKVEMEKFRAKEYDILVASTVVEVGVDIPDATRVVILSADRLGASSLHQIRGRVGRNSKPSKCYLVSLGKTDNSVIRLESLVNSTNGFDIAKSDLSVRGEGRIFGSEQSGRTDMLFASIGKHSHYIEDAKDEALRILQSPFRALAVKDAVAKFESNERLF